MSKRRRFRRSLAALVLLAILLAAGWTGVWYVIAGRVSDNIVAWERQQRAQGWTITHGAPRRAGWPMAAGVTLPGITISGGSQYLPEGLAWQAGSLTVAVDIRHLDDLYLGVAGRQTLSVAGGPAIPFQAATFAGQVALSAGDRPVLLQLHASGLIAAVTVTDGMPKSLSVAGLDAAVLADGKADATGNALVAAATMTSVDLPPYFLPGLGRRLRSLSFDVAVPGPAPTENPTLQPAGPDPAAMEKAWRKAGNTLALRALHLADGPLTLDGQGRFRLDALLRPEGNVALRVSGVNDTMDDLVDNGTLTRPEARALRAMLGLMMRPSGADVLEVPVNLRDDVVSLGAIPLIRLPH